jgi:heme-degrading monooxygenase HmoA
MTLAAALPAAQFAQSTNKPIELHLDLEVDPAKEQDLVKTFKDVFYDAISAQPGYVNVKLLKLAKELAGPAPANRLYRLVIVFATEQQRQTWVATDLHQQVWPKMEANLKGAKYNALLYESAG